MHAVKPLSQKPKDRKLASTRQCGSVRIEIESVERCDADALVAQVRAQHEADNKSSFSRGLKIVRRGISMSMLRLRTNSDSFSPSTVTSPSAASFCTQDTPPLTPDVSSFPGYSPCGTPSFISSPVLSSQSGEHEFQKPGLQCGVPDYVTAGTLSYLKQRDTRPAHPLHGLGLYLDEDCKSTQGAQAEYPLEFDASAALQHENSSAALLRTQISQLYDSSQEFRDDFRASYSEISTPGESMGSLRLHDLRSDFPSPPDRAAMAVNGRDKVGAHFHAAYRNAFNRRALQTQNLPAFHLNEVSDMSTIACRRKANGSNGESSQPTYANHSAPLQDAKTISALPRSALLPPRQLSSPSQLRPPQPHCVHPPEMTCLVEGGCAREPAMQFKSVGGPRRSSEAKILGIPNSVKPRNPSMHRSRSSPNLRKASKLSPPSPLPSEVGDRRLGSSSPQLRSDFPASLPSNVRDVSQRTSSAALAPEADGSQSRSWEACPTDPDLSLSWDDVLALQAGDQIRTRARTHLSASDRQKTSLDALMTNFSRPLSERTFPLP